MRSSDRPGGSRSRRAAAALGLAVALIGAGPAPAPARTIDLPVKVRTTTVAAGLRMRAWTFGGGVPGPVLRMQAGERVEVRLRNLDPARSHSIDLHAAEVDPGTAFADVRPGRTGRTVFVPRRAGVFMYHCGTNPVLRHIGMGMYGAVIVDPPGGRPPAQEVVLVQSEFYGPRRGGILLGSLGSMLADPPVAVAFNGRALRYRVDPIPVRAGLPVRVFVVNAGPNLDSAFHVVGEIFDTVQPDGAASGALHDVSTHLVPAGGGAVFELTFDHPGRYPFVSHKFASAALGALGIFEAR